MPKQAQRRFVKLDTEEVSLVDAPANEVPFLVTKNQETEMTTNAEQQKDDAVRVPVEAENGGNAVAEAMEHVSGIVDTISKMVTKNESSAESSAQSSEETQADDSEATTEDVSKATLRGALVAAGLKGDALKAACDKLEKAGFNPGQKFPSAQPPIKKSEDGEENQPQETDGLTIDSLAGAIQKAASFTPARIEQLRQAAETIKLVLEGVAPNASPKTRAPGVETHSNPSAVSELSQPAKRPVVKSEDGEEFDLVETLKALGDKLAKIAERVDAIEKTRNPSNSAEDDGVTDSTTQKSDNMWSGVL